MLSWGDGVYAVDGNRTCRARRSRQGEHVKAHLQYGKGTLEFSLPPEADVTIVEPRYVRGLADEAAAITAALRHPIGCAPLANRVKATDTVGIVFSDITRPTPYGTMLPPLLDALAHVPDKNIVLFNATGTHRVNTSEELETILGAEIARRFRIVQNDCGDERAHRTVGMTSKGNQVDILAEFLDCDIRIPTGFIEPHFFAGMSGGGKAIMPGLAGLATVQRNHSAAHMDHPEVRWGITEGNPLWEEVREAALMTDPTAILNVALNRDKEVTAVFFGDFLAAHAEGCGYVRDHAMAPVPNEFDIVVTGNSGYPLDLNMYQAVKGMSAASQIVRRGGHIIMAADCWDGIPEHGQYGQLLSGARSPGELLGQIRAPGFAAQDMWQAQIHALVCEKATVHFHSDNLSPSQIRSAFMEPCADIAARVAELIRSGSGSRVCVLPQGPMTIPYVN